MNSVQSTGQAGGSFKKDSQIEVYILMISLWFANVFNLQTFNSILGESLKEKYLFVYQNNLVFEKKDTVAITRIKP